jgi:hypothetical protein
VPQQWECIDKLETRLEVFPLAIPVNGVSVDQKMCDE